MRWRRVYQWLFVAACGSVVFETSGCASEDVSALLSSLSDSVITLVTQAIISWVNGYFGVSS